VVVYRGELCRDRGGGGMSAKSLKGFGSGGRDRKGKLQGARPWAGTSLPGGRGGGSKNTRWTSQPGGKGEERGGGRVAK